MAAPRHKRRANLDHGFQSVRAWQLPPDRGVGFEAFSVSSAGAGQAASIQEALLARLQTLWPGSPPRSPCFSFARRDKHGIRSRRPHPHRCVAP
jgi:hypothetical protein